MKQLKFKFLSFSCGVLAATVLACVGFASGAETANAADTKAAQAWRKIVDDGCNSYALSLGQYTECIEQRARELPPLDPAKREHFGELYDPARYLQCKKDGYRNDMGCDRYALRRIEQPEYWPYPDVPPMKWPEPPTPSVYEQLKKKHLVVTAKDYFEALCKAEAGEFVFKAVENVDGIYEIRPSRRSTDREFQDRYVLEDPWNAASSGWRIFQTGWKYWDSFGGQFVQPNHGKFDFSETPMTTGEKFPSRIVHVYRNTDSVSGRTITSVLNGKFVQVPYVVAWKEVGNVSANFGFTWRGIQRPHDREMNIAGSELAIVALASNEIIALRRDFVQTGKSRNTPAGVNWETAAPCGWPNIVLPSAFIHKVLKPHAR
ncbi:MAG: hypothetical protein KA388_10220 [Rhodocyclaceae bacterium]|nr:hypothetical protein [Rhodocyclaceae bacterium]